MTKLLSIITVASAAVFLAIASPALTGASDPSPQRIEFVHLNDRILDTRTGVKPTDGWSTTIQLDANYVGGVDWDLNVQVVQADSDGWVEVDGQSAVVHDGGRANAITSVSGTSGQIVVRLHGASAHVIVDLVKITTAEVPPPSTVEVPND